jgi:glycosyltransferase involved in cell wall biosynthesis
VKQDLLKIGISENSIKVINNGVDLQEFSPEKCNRKVLNLPENVTLALFVGDIRTPRRNLDSILKALVKVPELHLVVIGSIQGSPYPRLAAQLAVQKRVHFLGYRQDVSEVMKACDFFVFPSRYETFGLVVLEAMAAGLPVVTASTTGAAELVTSESGIVLSDPDDTQSLVKALITLSYDKKIRNTMGQAARQMAEKYTWKNVAESYINLFEEIELKQSQPLKLNAIKN